MGLPVENFEEKLHQYLNGELSGDQLRGLEEVTGQDAAAAREFEKVKRLRKALRQGAREHRRTTYPGNLAAEVLARSPMKAPGAIHRWRRAYVLAAALVLISSLIFLQRNRPVQNRASIVQPSLSVMADLQKELNEFRTAHDRSLADWSRRVTLMAPQSVSSYNIGLTIPERPTMDRQFKTIKNNAQGAKL